MRQPFYWEARKCWYVKSADRRNIRLDPDEAKARAMWEEMNHSLGNGHDGPAAAEMNGGVTMSGEVESISQAVADLRQIIAKMDELAAHQDELRRQISAAAFEFTGLRTRSRELMLALSDLAAAREERFDAEPNGAHSDTSEATSNFPAS
jgi:hypothetical protein